MSDEEEVAFVVAPYQFEPEDSSDCGAGGESSDGSSTSSSGSEEEFNIDPPDVWCKCRNCSIMPSVRECLCCKDVLPIKEKIADDMQCITEHEGFHGNCLNRHVLEVSFYEFLDDHGPIGNEEPIHEVYRYIAYRRFTRWIWHKLGKKNRRVIPACAVTAIRNAFPSETYSGFAYARDY